MLDLPIERFIYQYFVLDLTGHMEVQARLPVTQVMKIINLFKHPGTVTSPKHKYHHKHHCVYAQTEFLFLILVGFTFALSVNRNFGRSFKFRIYKKIITFLVKTFPQ